MSWQTFDFFDFFDFFDYSVSVDKDYMVNKAAALEVKTFKPKSGVVIHTNDEEAKQAEMQAGSEWWYHGRSQG